MAFFLRVSCEGWDRGVVMGRSMLERCEVEVSLTCPGDVCDVDVDVN